MKTPVWMNMADLSSIGSLAAAYIFTNPAMAKYLCQFVDTAVSFVNHIPTKLLCKFTNPSLSEIVLTAQTPPPHHPAFLPSLEPTTSTTKISSPV
jgi:hypothetical protein